MDKSKSLSIVIPNYKERRLMEVYAQCRKVFPFAEIILQDDLEGKGKGWALREGLAKSKDKFVCFIDGDFDIHPIEIYKLLEEIYDYDIVVGNRVYNASFVRKILNWGYKLFIRILFGWSLSIDTQSGVKLFNRYAIPEWTTDSFAFDIEILYKAKKNGMKIKEVPVISIIRKNKSIKTVWNIFIETLKLWKRLR